MFSMGIYTVLVLYFSVDDVWLAADDIFNSLVDGKNVLCLFRERERVKELVLYPATILMEATAPDSVEVLGNFAPLMTSSRPPLMM